MRILIYSVVLCCFCAACSSISTDTAAPRTPLIVVLSVDQFRGDFPTKFAPVWGDRGFKRVMKEGAWFSRCLYQHGVTQTGPGHATLLTGCYARRNGIVANDFCVVSEHECFNCSKDANGQASPLLLTAPTVGELLRDVSPSSKVVGVGLKDRSVVLMAGRNPSAIVFADFSNGRFVTSEQYSYPPWLAEYQREHSLLNYTDSVWVSNLPPHVVPEPDDVPWEYTFSDGSKTFPHRISTTTQAATVADVLLTPFSIKALFDLTTEAVRQEELGLDTVPDLLVVGLSTTDLVGHMFGPDSREMQELYGPVDAFVEHLIDTLDSRVGRNRYVLFVTGDHGVAPVPEVVLAQKQPGRPTLDAGRISRNTLKNAVDSALTEHFGKPPVPWIWEVHMPHIYLSDGAAQWAKVSVDSVAGVAAEALRSIQGVGLAYRPSDLASNALNTMIDSKLVDILNNDLAPDRAGDVLLYPKPYWIIGSRPTSHGTPWEYDRWVPLMVMGGGVSGGQIDTPVGPADVAATIARMWGLQLGDVDGRPLPFK